MHKNRTGCSHLVAVVLSATLAGCAGQMSIKMSDEARAQLQSVSGIRAVHYAPPPLTMTTAGRVLLDDVTFGTVPNSNYAARYAVPDPAVSAKAMLVQALERGGFRKLTNVEQPLVRGASDTVDVAKAAYGQGVVLDVNNINWGGMYFVSNWTRYRVGVVLQARLVRLDDQQVLWKSTCMYNTSDDGKIEPNMDELTANNGALFKKISADAARHCGQRLANEFFNRSVP